MLHASTLISEAQNDNALMCFFLPKENVTAANLSSKLFEKTFYINSDGLSVTQLRAESC